MTPWNCRAFKFYGDSSAADAKHCGVSAVQPGVQWACEFWSTGDCATGAAFMAVQEQVSIATTDGLSLRLPSGVAKDLAHRIAGAANALPKRGLEVCGLLLGEHSGKE